jgi:hypothetical protein
MEAALRVLRAALGDHFGREFSFTETHAYIADAIHLGDPLSQYLQDCWENRVMLVHPESRRGSYSIPPLLADDFYETYGALVTLYRFILIGEDRPRLRVEALDDDEVDEAT